jgi:hypothetical protein
MIKEEKYRHQIQLDLLKQISIQERMFLDFKSKEMQKHSLEQ